MNITTKSPTLKKKNLLRYCIKKYSCKNLRSAQYYSSAILFGKGALDKSLDMLIGSKTGQLGKLHAEVVKLLVIIFVTILIHADGHRIEMLLSI